ncbi:50S ribosomal protein L4 [bacterium]|nr:50S ribosomal protein L4 [bacterium]NCQ55055.1 50S ribosomal protein L4 [Candidatus Parcubacteria bacterium]NCS67099.1 50S ribosomal protein L4 [Candidatus Peregrinibacteria bacterium]NCS96045.1 50S ribosomal protein L4 [bacterium]
MKIDLYAADGKKKGDIEVSGVMFDAKINEDLMHRAVVLRLANKRNPIAHTKTRGEVSYSTRKVQRQKGTGNARRGSRSTNLLRGGGVTHGPTNQVNFTKMMPKKERKAALYSALTAKAKASEVFALELPKIETPNTKSMAALLTKLPVDKKILFIVTPETEMFVKSVRNLPQVKTLRANYLNPYDLLIADKVCFLDSSLAVIESTFLAKAS